MTVRKVDGRRIVEVSAELPGTPEDLWAAMATGPGISAWFVPTDVVEGVGGTVSFHLDQNMDSTGRITEWDPPRRLAYEEAGWMEGAPPLATEVIVEAKAGGMCVVRMAHSLFASTDDWDAQLEGMERGWPPFFDVLRVYQTEYRGQPCMSLRLVGSSTVGEEETWRGLTSTLGFSAGDCGASLVYTPQESSPLHGVDETRDIRHRDRSLLARLKEPTPGTALLCVGNWLGHVFVCVQMYYYGPGAGEATAQEAPKWRSWLGDHYPN